MEFFYLLHEYVRFVHKSFLRVEWKNVVKQKSRKTTSAQRKRKINQTIKTNNTKGMADDDNILHKNNNNNNNNHYHNKNTHSETPIYIHTTLFTSNMRDIFSFLWLTDKMLFNLRSNLWTNHFSQFITFHLQHFHFLFLFLFIFFHLLLDVYRHSKRWNATVLFIPLSTCTVFFCRMLSLCCSLHTKHLKRCLLPSCYSFRLPSISFVFFSS